MRELFNISMSDLSPLRNQLDMLDREIVSWFVSQTGEKTLGDMINERLEIVREIGVYKKHHHLTILDLGRRDEMIQSRVSWAPESSQELVRNFFEVIHDISVKVQESD